MKKFGYIISMWLLGTLVLNAKTFRVESFQFNPFDLTASVNSRFDSNEEACALIKIVLPDGVESVTAEGNVVGDVADDGSETFVYMTGGTKFVQLKSKGFAPFRITFSDYDIYRLEPRATYNLILGIDNSQSANESAATNPKSIFESLASPDTDPVDEMVSQANIAFARGQYAEAIPLLQKAASLGHPEAQLSIGLLYEKGLNDGGAVVLEKNEEKAFQNVFKSATQAFKPAQKELSRFYRVGIGTPEDKAKADNWKAIYDQQPNKSGTPDGVNFKMVEIQAEFPGGEQALLKWVGENLVYPQEAAEEGREGKVIVQFIVEKDGSVSNVKVVRGKHPALDAEAVRVVRQMPKWSPGIQNGAPVKTTMTMPITFRLGK